MDLDEAVLRKSLEAMGITSFDLHTEDEIKQWSGDALAAAEASLRKSFGGRCVVVLLVSDGLKQSIVTNLNDPANVISHLQAAIVQSQGGEFVPAEYTKVVCPLPPGPEVN